MDKRGTNRKTVLKFTKDGKLVAIFPSIKQASRGSGVSAQDLSYAMSQGNPIDGYRYFRGKECKVLNSPRPEFVLALIDRRNELKSVLEKIDDLQSHFNQP